MKKLIALLFAAVLCFGLCACGETAEELVTECVESRVNSQVFARYEGVSGVYLEDTVVTEISEDYYEFEGRVVVHGTGGTNYATYVYSTVEKVDGEYDVIEFDMGTPNSFAY